MWNLILLDAEGRETRRQALAAAAPLTIGRGKDRSIVLDSKTVSRQHAHLLLQDGQPLLVDEGSANGTRLNGQPVSRPLPLKDGDEIQIAAFRLRLQRAAPAAAAPAGAAQGGQMSAAALLQQQLAGIRSYRNETQQDSGKKQAEFAQRWDQVVASMRELQQQLQGNPRVMYFNIDRSGREITVKLADRNVRGGGVAITLSREHPQGEYKELLAAWICQIGEEDLNFADPQEAMQRFVQRIAARLA